MLLISQLANFFVVVAITIHIILECVADDVPEDGVKKIEIKKGISLAFAIDTTYSMTDDIEGSKAGAEAIMKLVNERDHYPIVNFVLSTFNDPDPPILFRTHSKPIFRQKLSELKVTKPNKDCPELAMGGIKLAVENSLENSVVYVFTDAAAKDVAMAEEVRKLANLKKVEITFLLTGDCDGRNEKNYKIYTELAKETNGVVYNLGSKHSVAEVLTYVGESLDERTRILAYVPVTGSGKNTHVDVDGTMKAFTITVNGKNPEIKITNPSGDVVNESRLLVKLNLSETLVVEIVDPEPGRWNIKTERNAGLIVEAVSDISFKTGFSFKRVTRFSDTIQEPIIGKLTVLTLSPIVEEGDDLWTPTIAQIIDIDGNPLEDPLSLSPIHGPEVLFHTPPFLTPEKIFNIAISGYDKAGIPIKRLTKVPIGISADVLDPPASSETSVHVVATAMDNMELKCKVEGKKLSIRWYKDKHPLYESGKYHFSDDYRTLTVFRMGNPFDAGKYECVGVNPSGQAVETYHVLFESIDIKEGRETVYLNVYENTRLELNCTPIGFFNPSVRWDHDGMPIRRTGEKLFLEIIQKTDNGTYRCIVQNDRNQLKTKHFAINVIVPQWNNWGAWTTCSKSCGTGIKVRRRSCILPGLGPKSVGTSVETTKCGQKSMDIGHCNYGLCEVDGGWTDWGDWSSCSRTCGKGEQTRLRRCNNPKPAFGGRYCIGHSSERKRCLISKCELDGGWSDWSEWSSCSVACGGGSRRQTRTCTNPPPSSGGAGCRGSNERSESCNTEPCKIDGGWSDWDDWTECSNKCGSGLKYSKRNCSNPVPQHGGRYCAGLDRKSEICENQCRPDKIILELTYKINSLINDSYSLPVNVTVKVSDEPNNKKLSFSTPDISKSKALWSPIWPFILSSAGWLMAHENGNNTNGFTLTRGNFFQMSAIRFDSEKQLNVTHKGMGLIDNGSALFIKVNATGIIPILPTHILRKNPVLDKTLMQIGPGEIHVEHQTDGRTNKVNYHLEETINYKKELGYMANKLEQLHSTPPKISFDTRPLRDKNVLSFATEVAISKVSDNSCPDGYVEEMGKYCQDIDECALKKNYCSDTCKNKLGSYECLCPEGKIAFDEYTCVDDEGSEPFGIDYEVELKSNGIKLK